MVSATYVIDPAQFDSKLRRMRLLRFGLVTVLVSPALISACRSSDNRSDVHGRSSGAGPGLAGSSPAVAWFEGTAPLLLAPGRSPDRSLIALADTTAEDPESALLDSNATFVRLDGTRSAGRVAITQTAEGCTEASIDPAPATAWGVGFIGASPTPLRADSVRNMSRTDSTALTHTAFRLASMVLAEPRNRFTGLPFALVNLWRVGLPDGSVAIVATLRRQINQEDSPLEERTLIVAESDSTAADGFSLAYSERSSGAEETVENGELLAAVAFARSSAVDLVVALDYGEETAYRIVERVSRGKWIKRWVSRRFSC